MNSEDFNKCREFLEKLISKLPENNDLLKGYIRLIELKSEYDRETSKSIIEKEIREAEFQSQYSTAVHAHNTEFSKTAHTNDTNHNMAVNQNSTESYKHSQTQIHGTVQSAFQHGNFQPAQYIPMV